MDKIARLRQEIERRHKYESKNYNNQKPDGRPNDGWAESLAIMGILEELLSLLDTLSEEPDRSLEEAADEYEKGYYDDCSAAKRAAYHGFIAGAEWQKSQMLKEAFVDNDVVHDGRIELEGDPLPSLDPILILPYPQFEPGDKVRIVVLKAEEE